MTPKITELEMGPREAFAAAIAARMLEKTEQFNREVVGLPIPEVPTILSEERVKWARAALSEEVKEFIDASSTGDVLEAADGLIDLVYFALGRLVEMGVPAAAVFEEVHRANMGKQRGELSKRPGSLGYDAVKPEGWKAPDHSWLLNFGLADLDKSRLWDNLSPFLQQAAVLRAQKGNDYNTGADLDDYFPLGHLSYFQMLHVKFLRIKSVLVLMALGRSTNYDSLQDSVQDMSNYLTFYGERLMRGDLPDLTDVAGMLKEVQS